MKGEQYWSVCHVDILYHLNAIRIARQDYVAVKG